MNSTAMQVLAEFDNDIQWDSTSAAACPGAPSLSQVVHAAVMLWHSLSATLCARSGRSVEAKVAVEAQEEYVAQLCKHACSRHPFLAQVATDILCSCVSTHQQRLKQQQLPGASGELLLAMGKLLVQVSGTEALAVASSCEEATRCQIDSYSLPLTSPLMELMVNVLQVGNV
jgi:hypothetical protein